MGAALGVAAVVPVSVVVAAPLGLLAVLLLFPFRAALALAAAEGEVRTTVPVSLRGMAF